MGAKSLLAPKRVGRAMTVGVILAAGASSRFGSPKALATLENETTLERTCRTAKQAGCATVIVVLGAHAKRVMEYVPSFAQVVVNENWAAGRTGSLQAAIHHAPNAAEVLVWPVDRPGARVATVDQLVHTPGLVRVPVQAGKRGHPIVLGARPLVELKNFGADQPLHDLVHSFRAHVVEVHVADAGIHVNLDVPEDLEQARSILGASR